MTRLILQPAASSGAREHYKDTIESPVDMGTLRRFLQPDEASELAVLYPGGNVPTWGVTPGRDGLNRRMWERIEPGDVTLFARKGRFVASAITTLKLRNKALALELWGTHETGATWEYVYFLSGVRRHDIPYADFNRVVSYQPKAVPQRFLVLDEAKSEAAIDFFQLASDRYFPHVSEDQFRDAVVTFDPSRPLDAEGKTKRRTEQRFLRQQMFGNQTVGTCAICGRQLPVGLLTAAHIKRRSECSDEERLDFENIAAPMCQLGCDALYEDGYLSVVEGRVVAAKHESLTPALAGRLGELAGTECRSWGEGTRSYFAWHHRHTFTG